MLSMSDTNAPQPLKGLRVIEFTHMVMGPTCGMVLADMGAEVIKIEPVAGENTRRLLGAGAGFFPMFNRNKKSIALNLHSEQGAALARKLCATADVVAENFKPGTMAKYGLDYASLCAVNPHASDGGLFGDEEARILEPARERLHAEGVDAHGPIPADTVFVRATAGEFDAVIAPYHDVGMAAFKTAAFGHGVNVTLGLPFVRTSPDHGTALDIAGRGLADPSSMKEAVRVCAAIADRVGVHRAASA